MSDSRIKNLTYDDNISGSTQFAIDSSSYTNAHKTTLEDIKEYVLDGATIDDTYTTGVTFDENTGNLLFIRNDSGAYLTNLDGRYALSGETGGGGGTDGTSGVDGENGTDGTSGINGENGTDGTSGINGVNGTDGTSGINGENGTSGVDGYLSGATDEDFWYDTGDDKLYTPKINLSGSTEFVEHGVEYYSLYIDRSTGDVYANSGVTGSGGDGTDGTSGINGINGTDGTSGINGETGADGTDGTSGINGETGADGTDGTSGINGVDGTDGTSGINGEIGADGTDGTSGINGVDGTDGTSGINGETGADGTDGTSGINGETGADGTSGINGEIGADGTDGTSGINGETGADGTDGTSGLDGADITATTDDDFYYNDTTDTLYTPHLNLSGETYSTSHPASYLSLYIDTVTGDVYSNTAASGSGTDGTSGINGENGTDGTSGIDGINGTDGTSGIDGINGENGTDGTSGIDGVNGENGTDGTSGIDGINGTSGIDGEGGSINSGLTMNTVYVDYYDGTSDGAGTIFDPINNITNAQAWIQNTEGGNDPTNLEYWTIKVNGITYDNISLNQRTTLEGFGANTKIGGTLTMATSCGVRGFTFIKSHPLTGGAINITSSKCFVTKCNFENNLNGNTHHLIHNTGSFSMDNCYCKTNIESDSAVVYWVYNSAAGQVDMICNRIVVNNTVATTYAIYNNYLGIVNSGEIDANYGSNFEDLVYNYNAGGQINYVQKFPTSSAGTVTSILTTEPIMGGEITSGGTIWHSDESGYKHIPDGGTDNQILMWSDTGTTEWVDPVWTANEGTVTGSGSENRLTKWDETGKEIENSSITDDGTAVSTSLPTKVGAHTTTSGAAEVCNIAYGTSSTPTPTSPVEGTIYIQI